MPTECVRWAGGAAALGVGRRGGVGRWRRGAHGACVRLGRRGAGVESSRQFFCGSHPAVCLPAAAHGNGSSRGMLEVTYHIEPSCPQNATNPLVRGPRARSDFGRRKTDRNAGSGFVACRPTRRTTPVDIQGLPGQPTASETQPLAPPARAGNKAQWAKRRTAYARKSCPWPRNKQRP